MRASTIFVDEGLQIPGVILFLVLSFCTKCAAVFVTAVLATVALICPTRGYFGTADERHAWKEACVCKQRVRSFLPAFPHTGFELLPLFCFSVCLCVFFCWCIATVMQGWWRRRPAGV